MAGRHTIAAILTATDKASPTFAKVRSALKVLGAVAAAVGAVQIGRLLVQGIGRAVEAASVQQLAEAKLAQAIRNTGQSVASVLPRLKAQASALQDLSGVGDEAILSQQAFLVSAGATGKTLDEMTRAAVELSAGMGISLESAFRNVGKTLSGLTGELGEAVPQIRNLTKEQLQAGEAATVLLQVFGGQAQAQLNTYAGRMTELKGRIGDLQEEIGGPFRDVFQIVTARAISPFVDRLTDGLKEGNRFREGIIRAALGVAVFGQTLESVVNSPVGQLGLQLFLQKLRRDTEAIQLGIALFNAKLAADTQQLFKNLGGLGKTPVFDAIIEDLKKALSDDVGEGLSVDLDATGVGDIYKDLSDALAKVDPGPLVNLREESLELVAAWDKINAAFQSDAITGDQFGEVSVKVLELKQEIEALGGAVEGVFLQAADAQQKLGIDEALRAFVEDGAAGVTGAMEKIKADGIEPIGESLERNLRGIGVDSALSLGDALADAATGADVAWSQFFKSFIRDIIAAIAKALILQAIGSAFGPVGQVAAGAASSVVANKAAGGLVMGGIPGVDSVPTMLMPGEYVLPKRVTDQVMRGNATIGAPQRGGLTLNYAPNLSVGAGTSEEMVRRILRDEPQRVVDALKRADIGGF